LSYQLHGITPVKILKKERKMSSSVLWRKIKALARNNEIRTNTNIKKTIHFLKISFHYYYYYY